jgi:hypothetical protein
LSHISGLNGGLSGVDSIAINNGNGAQRLKDIFTSVMSGAAGPSLAKETFRAARQQQAAHASQNQSHPQPQQPPHPTSTHHAPFPNLSMSREQADFEVAQFTLKQAKMVSLAVSSIAGTIKKDQLLLPDGSNFSQWTRLLQEIGLTHLTGLEFFLTSCNNLSFE